MRHNQHLQGVLLTVGLLNAMAAQAQDVVVDQYGTEYAANLMPQSFTRPQVSEATPVGATGKSKPMVARAGDGSYLGPQQGQPSEDILVGSLTGVVLVPTPGDVVVTGIPGVRGIWHDLENFPPKAGNAINAYLGKPVSLATLDMMVKDVIQAYRASDRPVVDVLVPEQDITSGVVQLVVVEGRLDNIRVVGADLEEEQYLRNLVSTGPGEVLRSSQIQSDLSFMNRSPYRRVDLVYAPGYRFATTDIVLRTNEIDPFAAYATYENSGNRILGRDRLIFGAAWREAFGRPDNLFSYQLTADIDFEQIISHSLVYSMPFRWRHYFTFMAAHVRSEARVDLRTGEPVDNPNPFTIDIRGANWQLSPRYTIPLRKAPPNVAHEIEFGYDYKSISNNLEFGTFDLTPVETHEIHQFSIGYNRTRQWDNGATRIDLTGYISPGGANNHNEDEVFTLIDDGAQASYAIMTASLEHTQQLPRGLTGRARVQGQMASEDLVPSEELGIGGPSTVRGFETSVARDDEGIIASLELYSPVLSPSDRFGWQYCKDELRFLLFADFASVSPTYPDPGAVNDENRDLFSLGAGMRYTFNEWLRLRVDAGLPISYDLPEQDADRVADIFWHVGATAQF